MSWNQPVCWGCWRAREGERVPVRVRARLPERHVCAFCGEPTCSGIFLRAHPESVPFPRRDEETEA